MNSNRRHPPRVTQISLLCHGHVNINGEFMPRKIRKSKALNGMLKDSKIGEIREISEGSVHVCLLEKP